MPKDNIERAIKKGIGSDAASFIETTFEGYASNGVAIFVECLTDNHNRTVSNVRSVFTKYGGSLGTSGSLDFILNRKGVFTFPITDNFDEEEFELEVIDAGAEDIELTDGYVNITTAMGDFGSMNHQLNEMAIETETAELQRIPVTTVDLDDDVFTKVMKLVEALEDNDDVQKVYHNIGIRDTQLELVS